MKRTGLLSLLLLAVLTIPGTSQARPAGPHTNPLGSLQWLPDYANENPPSGRHRLVVVYDWSLTSGKPDALLAKGAFAMKLASLSPELRMTAHSSGVNSIGAAPVDGAAMALEGDVRDGACSLAGTPGFSEAYSYTRTFNHSGSQPYVPRQGPGVCEVVESSTPQSGGFRTRVTTHVPGFWMDVSWPSRNGGRLFPQIWYEAVYDTDGQAGSFLVTADETGGSGNVSEPPS